MRDTLTSPKDRHPRVSVEMQIEIVTVQGRSIIAYTIVTGGEIAVAATCP
jgi:hypothetical protein